MLKNIIIVMLLANVVVAWGIILQCIKSMNKLEKAAEDFRKSIDVKRVSEDIMKDVMKHVYYLGYGRIKFLR